MQKSGVKNLKKSFLIILFFIFSFSPVFAITPFQKNNFFSVRSSAFSWRSISSKTFYFAHTLPKQISKYVLSSFLMVTPVLGYMPKPMGGYVVGGLLDEQIELSPVQVP